MSPKVTQALPHRAVGDSAVRAVPVALVADKAAVLVVRQALDPMHKAEVRDRAVDAAADR